MLSACAALFLVSGANCTLSHCFCWELMQHKQILLQQQSASKFMANNKFTKCCTYIRIQILTLIIIRFFVDFVKPEYRNFLEAHWKLWIQFIVITVTLVYTFMELHSRFLALVLWNKFTKSPRKNGNISRSLKHTELRTVHCSFFHSL